MQNNWYYSVNGQTLGPIPLDVLRQMAKSKVIDKDTQVIVEGQQEWMRAGTIPALFGSQESQSREPNTLGDLAAAIPAHSQSRPPSRKKKNALPWIIFGVVTLIVLLVMVIRGRSPSPDAAPSPNAAKKDLPQSDPKASFEEFCRRYVTNIPKTQYVTPDGRQLRLMLKPSYGVDLQKTSSLMSPYIGTLNIECDTGITFQLTIALQDKTWVLRDVTPDSRYAEAGHAWEALDAPDLLRKAFDATPNP